MPSRADLPAQDRAARARLMKLLSAAAPLARASLVTMRRVCGKPTCKCARGDKHVSLYLATRLGAKRTMLYVPPDLEARARRLAATAQRAEALLEQMSQASLERFVKQKKAKAAKKGAR